MEGRPDEQQQIDGQTFQELMTPLRRELLLHCYRMTGSSTEAEDLLQDALFRAWRAYPLFEGRGEFKSWLYKIVTNVCFSALRRRSPRLLPWSREPAYDPQDVSSPPLGAEHWLEPLPDQVVGDNPEHLILKREATQLSFMLLLQHLTPQQRAALVLRDVAGFRAKEVAEIMDTTEDSINSALVRARAAIKRLEPAFDRAPHPDDVTASQWRRALDYVRATETSDLALLSELLRQDARLCMPPLPLWLHGRDDIVAFLRRPGHAFARQAYRLQPTAANGSPAFGVYEKAIEASVCRPIGHQVLDIKDNLITDIYAFLTPRFVMKAGLPAELNPYPAGEERMTNNETKKQKKRQAKE